MRAGAAAPRALFGRHCRQRVAANYARNDLGSVQQRLWHQMGVALGHPGLGVAEQSLDHIERHTPVDQEAGERMPQVMEQDISQTCAPPYAVPGMKKRRVRATCGGRGEDVLAALGPRERLQQGDGRSIERDSSGLAGFGDGETSRVQRCQSMYSHLAWVISFRRAPVSSRSMMAWAATWCSSALMAAMSRLVSSALRKRCRLTSGAVLRPAVGLWLRHAPIDQEAGERVAQVVEPDIGETCATSSVPRSCVVRGSGDELPGYDARTRTAARECLILSF
jgi:hypothetical protein